MGKTLRPLTRRTLLVSTVTTEPVWAAGEDAVVVKTVPSRSASRRQRDLRLSRKARAFFTGQVQFELCNAIYDNRIQPGIKPIGGRVFVLGWGGGGVDRPEPEAQAAGPSAGSAAAASRCDSDRAELGRVDSAPCEASRDALAGGTVPWGGQGGAIPERPGGQRAGSGFDAEPGLHAAQRLRTAAWKTRLKLVV